MITGRCEARAAKTGLMGFISVAFAERPTRSVRCRLDAGHDGAHEAFYQPFPGFADERVTWGDPPLPEYESEPL